MKIFQFSAAPQCSELEGGLCQEKGEWFSAGFNPTVQTPGKEALVAASWIVSWSLVSSSAWEVDRENPAQGSRGWMEDRSVQGHSCFCPSCQPSLSCSNWCFSLLAKRRFNKLHVPFPSNLGETWVQTGWRWTRHLGKSGLEHTDYAFATWSHPFQAHET